MLNKINKYFTNLKFYLYDIFAVSFLATSLVLVLSLLKENNEINRKA